MYAGAYAAHPVVYGRCNFSTPSPSLTYREYALGELERVRWVARVKTPDP